MFKTTISSTVIALFLTTFSAPGAFSIVAVTEIQTNNIESSNTGSNADDMADFLAIVTGVADNSDDQHYRDPVSHYEKYVGIGFALINVNPSD